MNTSDWTKDFGVGDYGITIGRVAGQFRAVIEIGRRFFYFSTQRIEVK